MTTSDFVYSSLSFYAGRHGGELPGLWFVQAIGALGVEETAIRQTLYRMEHSGELVGRTVGRTKLYGATPTTRAVIDVGASRILQEPDQPHWDGLWTLVRFVLENRHRKARDLLRDVLLVEGFASLGPGLYVHPRQRADRVLEAAEQLGHVEAVHVFRGSRLAGPEETDFVNRLWDLPATALRYGGFTDRFLFLEEGAKELAPQDAFALRFALVSEFLRITWNDPDLPPELLPDDWPADTASGLARRLYKTLLPGAVRFGDEVMDRARTRSPVKAGLDSTRRTGG